VNVVGIFYVALDLFFIDCNSEYVIVCLLIVNILTKNIRLFHPSLPTRSWTCIYIHQTWVMFTYLSLLSIHAKWSFYFVINWHPHSQWWLMSPCLPRCKMLFFSFFLFSHRHVIHAKFAILVLFPSFRKYSLVLGSSSTLLVMMFLAV
jgi:hypothetical protein